MNNCESKLLDLAVVMPIYNEEACIVNVIKSWLSILNSLNINYCIIALNDGSTDNTEKVLAIFEDNNSVDLINKNNSGHGPTILMGYKKAVEIAEWVFQCDSDDEMKADYFPFLWEKREDFDALFGTRRGRIQNLSRKVISACSRLTVRILYGKGVTDVNTAYRLISAKILKKIVTQIPDDVFAPNVIISGVICKAGMRIYEYPVPMEFRKTGSVSIVKWKLWKSAIKALFQTLFYHPTIDINREKQKITHNEVCT